MNKILPFGLLTFFIFLSFCAFSQEITVGKEIKVPHDICIYKPDPNPIKGYVPRANDVEAKMSSKNVAPCTTFEVSYSGFESFPQAQAAFQFAVDIWANSIESSQTIRILAQFSDLAPGVLGSAGADSFWQITGTGIPPNTAYPVALAEALTSSDINNSFEADINANFSNGSNGINWYFGTDGFPGAGEFDFVSVVLHEIGHGLGMAGFGRVDDNDNPTEGILRNGGFLAPWDNFIENGDPTSILTFTDPSVDLLNEYEGNDLFSNGSLATTENGSVKPKIYAPLNWNGGSSYSHWDEDTFMAGHPSSLMTPQIGNGEAIHDPGPVTLRFMEDMGWTICDGALSSNDVTLDNLFSYYPNPTKRTLNIKSNELLDKIEVYSILGKVIISTRPNGLEDTIDLSNLNSGAYFLKVTIGNTAKTVKIIKN